MINKLFPRLRFWDRDLKELLRGATKALFLKIFAAIIALVFNIVIIKTIGADKSGIYFLSFTIVTILATISCFGMNIPLVKVIASNIVLLKWENVHGIYRTGLRVGLIISVSLFIIIFYSSDIISTTLFDKKELADILKIMLIGVVPYTLSLLHSSALRGRKSISDSMFVLNVSTPLLTLIGTLFFSGYFNIYGVAWSFVFASFATLGYGRWKWVKGRKYFNVNIYKYSKKKLFDSSIPMFWVDIFQIFVLRFSIIILGVYESSKNIAIFNVASRVSILISFILIAVNSIAGPKIAEMFRKKEIANLKKLSQSATEIMSIIALIAFLLVVFFAKFIMGLFSHEFVKEGANILVIMGFAQFITVSTGVVGLLLTMTGNEKIWRNIILLSAIISVFMHFVLVPKYGIWGATIAQSCAIMIQLLIAVIFVWKKFNILTLPFARFIK